MGELSGLYTLEYSRKQKCFHISTLYEVCENNTMAIVNRWPVDYLLIGVFDTYEEASEYAGKLKRKNNAFIVSQPL